MAIALLLPGTGLVRLALAMGPDAVTAIATRLSADLPATTGWTRANTASLAPETRRRLDAESLDPEPFAALHRFDATLSGLAAGADPQASGGAIDELLAATNAVSFALASPDATALAAPLVRMASAACDLADPFMTTRPDAAEVPGARAAFSDMFDPASFTATDSLPADLADLGSAAGAMAMESAALRESVEYSVAAGDDSTIEWLRNQRLDAALALARAALQQAQVRAGAAIAAKATGTRLSIWPTPARGAVRVAFTLPAAAAARLEVLDVSGRLMIERSLGTRVFGPQSVVLEANGIKALPAGTYFVRIHAGNAHLAGRMVRIDR